MRCAANMRKRKLFCEKYCRSSRTIHLRATTSELPYLSRAKRKKLRLCSRRPVTQRCQGKAAIRELGTLQEIRLVCDTKRKTMSRRSQFWRERVVIIPEIGN